MAVLLCLSSYSLTLFLWNSTAEKLTCSHWLHSNASLQNQHLSADKTVVPSKPYMHRAACTQYCPDYCRKFENCFPSRFGRWTNSSVWLAQCAEPCSSIAEQVRWCTSLSWSHHDAVPLWSSAMQSRTCLFQRAAFDWYVAAGFEYINRKMKRWWLSKVKIAAGHETEHKAAVHIWVCTIEQRHT